MTFDLTLRKRVVEPLPSRHNERTTRPVYFRIGPTLMEFSTFLFGRTTSARPKRGGPYPDRDW